MKKLPPRRKCKHDGCTTQTRHSSGHCAEHVHLHARRVEYHPAPRRLYLHEEMEPTVHIGYSIFKKML